LELGIQQENLDVPEVLWKAFIDFEIDEGEHDRVRELYKSLLKHTNHIKVWASWTAFEIGVDKIDEARKVFETANLELSNSSTEERLLLLETWRDFEKEHGTEETREAVQKLMPVRRKRRRRIQTADGADAGHEEYFEYEFPDKREVKTKNKLLQMAEAFKKRQQQTETAELTDRDAPQLPDEDQPE
jgi:crooked neck